MNKVLIVIPAYNEEASIERVVDNLIQNFEQYDYIVVNDGSMDSTADICHKKGYNLLDLPINLGLAGAFQTGVRYAYKNGYDMVLQLDGDGQHRPEYIEKMVETMKGENVDIVIGSRFVESGKRKFSLRTLGSYIIGYSIKLTTGTRIYDPTSGMRLYHRNIMREFAYIMNYTPEPDTISLLMKRGVKVKEIQVEMDERIAGESYLNIKNAVKYMVHMCFSILFVQGFRLRGGK